MTQVYLDFNATTPLWPSVKEAMIQAMDHVGNPSSVHSFGRASRKVLEETRTELLKAVNGLQASVIFTSGGTEANNLAIQGFVRHRKRVGLEPHVFVSATDHDSTRDSFDDRRLIPVTTTGILDLEHLETQLSSLRTHDVRASILVSVSYAQNETGVIQPLAPLRAIAQKYGAMLHTDASQAFGKIPIDFTDLDVDLMTVSAHKIGGPSGIGALIIRDGVLLESIKRGGGQEQGHRPGSQNLIGIAGFKAAIQEVTQYSWDPVQHMKQKLERALREISPESQIFGSTQDRLPNTTMIHMPEVLNETQVMAFDLAGFAVSAGAACSSGKVKASPSLLAMGVSEETAQSALRISLGWTTQEKELENFIKVWEDLYTRTRRKDS